MNNTLKILVAEDNIINQRVIKELLKKLGFGGMIANNGQEALDCLKKNSFDLLILDVMMPIKDGKETLTEIRLNELETRKHLPIIISTAHDDPLIQNHLKTLGADGFVPKPINIDVLSYEINRVI